MHLRKDLPGLISGAALLLTALIAGVWDDFPLNDDWVYAHAAKRFAETGVLQVGSALGIGSSTAMAGQTLLAGSLIRVVGFSHSHLRGLTIAFAILLCSILNRILYLAGVTRTRRAFCLLTFAVNPIAANLAFSFMTEFYGYVAALAGVLVWLAGRAAADRADAPRLISISHAVIAAALIGVSFWIRQFCVAAFPAVLIATALGASGERRDRIRRSFAPVAWATVVFLGVVAAYYWWARASGNLAPGNAHYMANVTAFFREAWVVMPLSGFAYVTFFVLPILSALQWRGMVERPVILGGLGCAALITATLFAIIGVPQQNHAATLHQTFPYLSNIFHNAGVGPLTTTDIYINREANFPHWEPQTWILVEVALILGSLLWAASPGLAGLTRSGKEVFYFGTAFTVITLLLVVQVCQMLVFDRYFFGLLIGGVLSSACLMAGARVVWWRGGIVLFAFALFTVGGVHDYFGWNRARWELVAAARNRGVLTADLDGGWEVNGWFRFQLPNEKPALPVIHKCAYAPTCLNDAFVIGSSLPAGYTVADSRQPLYWLAKGPPLLLCRRNDVSLAAGK